MSGYSDDYKDYQQRLFIDQWVPESIQETPSIEQYRFILARMRAAEAKVDGFEKAIKVFKREFNL